MTANLNRFRARTPWKSHVAVDGAVVLSGRVPKAQEIRKLLGLG